MRAFTALTVRWYFGIIHHVLFCLLRYSTPHLSLMEIVSGAPSSLLSFFFFSLQRRFCPLFHPLGHIVIPDADGPLRILIIGRDSGGVCVWLCINLDFTEYAGTRTPPPPTPKVGHGTQVLVPVLYPAVPVRCRPATNQPTPFFICASWSLLY